MRSDRATARWREGEAVRLRLEGLDYESIAAALGYRTRSAAWKACDRGLRRTTAGSVDRLRDQVLADTYILQEQAWAAACAGQLGAIDRCLRALDQRARIIGLYDRPSPSKRSARARPRRDNSTWRESDEPLGPPSPEPPPETDEGWDVDRLVVFRQRDEYT